jgi:hypothetical protein
MQPVSRFGRGEGERRLGRPVTTKTAIAAFKSLLLFGIGSSIVLAQEAEGIRLLLTSGLNGLRQELPNDARLLTDAHSIESFLKLVDGTPPDWAEVYGHGGHDERLFTLNRERDRLRGGRTTTGLVTFFWDAQLSDYDPHLRGFRLAIGPRMIPTSWGVVRFKPESVPSELVAMVSRQAQNALLGRAKVEIIVVMTGRLVPEESIIYDFSHEEPGKGMVMPVVRIERLDYLLLE